MPSFSSSLCIFFLVASAFGGCHPEIRFVTNSIKKIINNKYLKLLMFYSIILYFKSGLRFILTFPSSPIGRYRSGFSCQRNGFPDVGFLLGGLWFCGYLARAEACHNLVTSDDRQVGCLVLSTR